MLIPKGDPVEVGRRGEFKSVVKSLLDTNFSGYVEVSYKTDELSRGRVLIKDGKVLAAGVTKVLSKREILGNQALSEMLELRNCVVDVYSLSGDKLEKAVEWNRNAVVSKAEKLFGVEEVEVKPTKVEVESETSAEAEISEGEVQEIEQEVEKISEEEKKKILEKYRIKVPDAERLDEVIANLLEVSPDELAAEMAEFADSGEVVADRGELMKKYGIEEPSMTEIEKMIFDALGEVPPPPGTVDMNEVKAELKKIADEYLDKMSRKVKEVIDKCSSPDDLDACIEEVKRVANSVAIFVPKKKIDRMIEEMQEYLRFYMV